jgi:outer membrane protein, heavy metal efflux system
MGFHLILRSHFPPLRCVASAPQKSVRLAGNILVSALLACSAMSAQHVCAQSVAASSVLEPMSLWEVEQKVATNRTIAVLEKAAAVARADIERVNVRPNPTLSAQLGNSLGGRYGLRETERLIRIEQLFERGNKQALRTGNATALAAAAQAEIAAAIREQRQMASQTYFDLALAQSQVILLQENLKNYERLLDGINRRLTAGDIAAVEVSRLKVETARANNELRAGQAQVIRASIELSQQINRENDTSLLRAKEALPGAQEIETQVDAALKDIANRKTDAASQRAELRAAQARIDAASKALDLSRQLRTRDFSLGMQAERSLSSEGTVFAFSASVPLFIFNDYRGDINKAQAELDQAQLEKERISLAVQNQIDQALAQLLAAKDRAQRLLKDAVPTAKQAADAIEFGFLKGAGTLTDLFDARRQYNSVRQEAEAAKAEVAKALSLLRLSTWVEPL